MRVVYLGQDERYCDMNINIIDIRHVCNVIFKTGSLTKYNRS